MALAVTPLTKFPTARRKNMDAQNWEVGVEITTLAWACVLRWCVITDLQSVRKCVITDLQSVRKSQDIFL
jgi:hypothetical protein